MQNSFGDNRLAELLHFFCNTPAASLSIPAERLGVSTRTIRNDLRQLNQQLEGCAAISGEHGKYTLRVYDADRFTAVRSRILEADAFLNSPQTRVDHIFGRLMRSREPLLTDELAYEMNVGRSTLVSDLRRLRAALEPYRLAIRGKTGSGLALEGKEADIRQYVLENCWDALYRDYPLDADITETVRSAFADTPFEKPVQEAFERCLTIMLDRALTGFPLGPLSTQAYNLTARPEFAVVARLIDAVGGLLHSAFPVEEKLFVLFPIIGMRTPADVLDMQQIELDPAMRTLSERVFRQIRLETGIRIENPAFIEEFLYHLMFMMNRLRFRVRLKNPLLDELREKYPLAWQLAGIAAKVVQASAGVEVPESERGYLASYFGVFLEEHDSAARPFRAAVICGTGRVTARLVAAQLRKVPDSSAELTLFSSEKVTPQALDGFDIVFTTVDLPCACEKPVIRVHEIFSEQELRHKLEKARYWDQVDAPVLDNNWFVMVGSLDESRFFTFGAGETYESAVEHMARTLTDAGQLDPGYLDRLRARERKGTMVFDHAVAIPHCLQFAGDRLVLAVGVFPEPVRQDGNALRIIFLLGLPEQIGSDESLLIRIYDEIISIAQDAALLDRIARADTFPALLQALYRQV